MVPALLLYTIKILPIFIFPFSRVHLPTSRVFKTYLQLFYLPRCLIFTSTSEGIYIWMDNVFCFQASKGILGGRRWIVSSRKSISRSSRRMLMAAFLMDVCFLSQFNDILQQIHITRITLFSERNLLMLCEFEEICQSFIFEGCLLEVEFCYETVYFTRVL